jgi:hypothetical protein
MAAPASEVGQIKEDLNALDERVTALEQGGTGSGLTEGIKQALLQIAQKVAYVDADGQDYYDDLYDALYPPATLVRIDVVYTQSGTVYTTDSLDSLKSDLVVTAIYTDQTTETVTNYTLSGTLAVGTSTITVTYGGMTDTLDVTVTYKDGQSYLTLNDIVERTGLSGLAVSNNGTVTAEDAGTFSVLEINPNLFPMHMSLSNRDVIYRSDGDGSLYGFDPGGRNFKFTKNGNVYAASEITGGDQMIKSGTTAGNFVADIISGELILTYSSGNVHYQNANCFGVWASSTNKHFPNNCEVNYDGTV